ncbi:MAG TPA: DUF554 domain-containing protein [Lachnospiraceae bacterium]|nr:DUF554 domain-containing protein [Lachnospiraceae bacterium]
MAGLGTIINVGGILIGGILGILFGKRMKRKYQDALVIASGVCVLFIGIQGALEEMLKGSTTMMLITSIALGTLLGEIIDFETRFEHFGEWLKQKTKSHGDVTFVDGFVTTSFTVCIGAMAVVGSIQDGIFGDYSILIAKTILDTIIVMIMTASMGKGCIFSAIPVALFQGSITLLAKLMQPIMTESALANLSLVGSVLIFCVGLNLVWGKKVKVANMLPSLIFAVIWAFI